MWVACDAVLEQQGARRGLGGQRGLMGCQELRERAESDDINSQLR